MEALGRLESKLSTADKHARDLLKGRGRSEIDEALRRTSSRALALRQQFEKSQAAIASVTKKAAAETRKQTTDTKALTDAGNSLDAMMRKFSRNATTGQKAVSRAIENTRKTVERTDTALKKTTMSSNRAAMGMRNFGNSGRFASQSLTGLIARMSAFIGGVAAIRDVASEYGKFDQAVTSAVAKFSRLEPALKPGTEAFQRFKDEIRAATDGTEHSAEGAARAADFWAKAGRSSEETKAVLKTTLDFASANQDASGSMLDVARAGDILSDALGQFRMPMGTTQELMSSTARVADVMSAAANRANMSAEELFEAFKGAGPTLTLVGSDIEETSALLAAMANAGIKGAAAGTQLKMSIANLSAMTGPQEAAMEKLGVTVKDADGNFRGLTTIIRDLNEATKEMGTADRAQVFAKAVGRRALPSFINLLAEGKTRLDATTAALDKASGETDRLATMMRQSASAQMEMFKNKLRSVGFEIIEKTGIVAHLTKAIQDVDWGSVSKTIQNEVVPALKTFGKLVSGTVIPAFKRAYDIVSTALSPVIGALSFWFDKLSLSGETNSKILGNLIALWLAFRGYLLAVKAAGIISWFRQLIGQMTAAATAQTALNTSTAATNVTLGQQVKSFGRLKTAMGSLTAFVIGWEIGTILHDKLVEPFMKARHEMDVLNSAIADTMSLKASSRNSAQLKGDLEKLYVREKQILEDPIYDIPGMGATRDASLLALRREMKRLGAEIPRAQKREQIQKYAPTGETALPEMTVTPEYTGQSEWDVGGRTWQTDEALRQQRSVSEEQSNFQRKQAASTEEYQKKHLELLKNQEPKSVVYNTEIGPATYNIDAKGMDPKQLTREVERMQKKREREANQAARVTQLQIAPVEI